MIKELHPGRYVVAVSGGVDSAALLHMLHDQPGVELVVAHYDHGIRDDSAKDRQLVHDLARDYGIPFVYHAGRLGKNASEDAARVARYAFLRSVKNTHDGQAIITAHHQDDVLETIIHNISRGTGRLGLSPMHASSDIIRPLMGMTKKDLIAYAEEHNLTWREDPTNEDDKYKRNHIRHNIVPKMSDLDKQQLLTHAQKAHQLNTEINSLIQEYFNQNQSINGIKRHSFIMLPHHVSREVMAAWLRNNGVRNFDKKTIERLTHAAKTYQVGKQASVNGAWIIDVKTDYLALKHEER